MRRFPHAARANSCASIFRDAIVTIASIASIRLPSIRPNTVTSTMPTSIDPAIRRIFHEARTHAAWTDRPVSDDTLRELYDILRWGPTAANCSPLRVVFVRSREAKERLRPALSPGNVDKTMAAPVTAIVAYDLAFPDTLPKLFPHTDARSWYAGNEPYILETATRNGSLQGGYFIVAARALGASCSPTTPARSICSGRLQPIRAVDPIAHDIRAKSKRSNFISDSRIDDERDQTGDAPVRLNRMPKR